MKRLKNHILYLMRKIVQGVWESMSKLSQALLAVQNPDVGDGVVLGAALLYDKMPVRHGCNLGQMGDTDVLFFHLCWLSAARPWRACSTII